MWDLEASTAEVVWAHDHGLRGVNFPAPNPALRIPPYQDPAWEPFFAACAERNMVLNTHIGGGEMSIVAGYTGVPAMAAYMIESPWLGRRAMWLLTFSGVFDRHPNLKLVLTELPGTWWELTVSDMDGAYFNHRAGLIRETLPKKPSEYVASNIFMGASFQSRQEAEMAVDGGFDDKLMWGSDYPHAEGTWIFTEDLDDPSLTKLSLANTFHGLPSRRCARCAARTRSACTGSTPSRSARSPSASDPTCDDLTEPDLSLVPERTTAPGSAPSARWPDSDNDLRARRRARTEEEPPWQKDDGGGSRSSPGPSPVIGDLQRARKGSQPEPDAAASAALPEFYAAGGVASANLFVDPDGTEDACLNLLWLKLGSNFTIPRHNHTGDCLYYVASGSVHLGNQVIEAGGGFFVPSAAPYTYSAGPEGAEVLEFRGRCTRSTPSCSTTTGTASSRARAPTRRSGPRSSCRSRSGRAARRCRSSCRPSATPRLHPQPERCSTRRTAAAGDPSDDQFQVDRVRRRRRTLLAVPAEVEPAELAQLLDFAERPHTENWSLRAALVRYAQPQPQRVNDLLDLVRRIQAALGEQSATLQRDGEEIWDALEHDTRPPDVAPLVELLDAAREIDRLGDALAEWAVDISRPRPDDAVDAVIADVAGRLERLGIPHEERVPPRRSRG